MTEALTHLREGHWLHIFPEGRCWPHSVPPQPLRWGAGKLVVDCLALGVDVRVVVWMHAGMERVLPLGGWVPRVGQEVWVMVGREEVDVRGVVERWRRMERANMGWGDPWPPPEEELYKEVTQAMEMAMQKTGEELRRRIRQHRAAAATAADGR